jgi:hypothetical protein
LNANLRVTAALAIAPRTDPPAAAVARLNPQINRCACLSDVSIQGGHRRHFSDAGRRLTRSRTTSATRSSRHQCARPNDPFVARRQSSGVAEIQAQHAWTSFSPQATAA